MMTSSRPSKGKEGTDEVHDTGLWWLQKGDRRRSPNALQYDHCASLAMGSIMPYHIAMVGGSAPRQEGRMCRRCPEVSASS
jgi:hypothetical protein